MFSEGQLVQSSVLNIVDYSADVDKLLLISSRATISRDDRSSSRAAMPDLSTSVQHLTVM